MVSVVFIVLGILHIVNLLLGMEFLENMAFRVTWTAFGFVFRAFCNFNSCSCILLFVRQKRTCPSNSWKTIFFVFCSHDCRRGLFRWNLWKWKKRRRAPTAQNEIDFHGRTEKRKGKSKKVSTQSRTTNCNLFSIDKKVPCIYQLGSN